MTNYSTQLDKFIKSELYATSFYKKTDDRTHVAYYQDEDKLIHSNQFNYSILGIKPVSEIQFKKQVAKEINTNVSFV